MIRIGVISDTHGLIRMPALAALRGVAHIIHAGDIGKPEVLQALQALAPVSAVRGNNDQHAWADTIPDSLTVEFEGHSVFVLHDLKELKADPIREGWRVVISGHSHRPSVREEAGVLYLNPGSAGPRRFKLPISVALLDISAADVSATIQTIEVDG